MEGLFGDWERDFRGINDPRIASLVQEALKAAREILEGEKQDEDHV